MRHTAALALVLAMTPLTPLAVRASCGNNATIGSNGGFESGDLSGWASVGLVTLDSGQLGIPVMERTYQAVALTDVSAPVEEVETAVGASSGQLSSVSQLGVPFEGSALTTSVFASAGQVIAFQYDLLMDDIFHFAFVAVCGSPTLLADVFTAGFVP